MTQDIYQIRVRDGPIEIDISGDREFVDKTFKEVRSMINKRSRSLKQKRGRKPKKAGRKKKPKPKKLLKKDRMDLKALSLEKLFEVKKPKRENQRVLLLAYHMNKVRKKREFRGKDLEPLYKELNLKAPDNLSYFLRKMSEDHKGLITHGRKQGRYKITDKGIDFIHEVIPTA